MKKLLKKTYWLLPENLKKAGLSVIKKVVTPSGTLQQSFYFDDFFKVKNDTFSFDIWHTGKWIENDLFWKGIDGYEKVTMKIWIALCKKAEIIFDIGANTGVFSLVAASNNSSAKIYAFEPLPQTFKILDKNILKNSFNIQPVQFAVSDQEGSSTFYFPEEGNIYSSTLSAAHFASHNQSKATEIKVNMVTLANFIESNSIQKLDLIKIDAEGNDLNVFKGMGPYLARFRPNIIVEVHDDSLGEEIEKLVKDLKYVFFDIDEKTAPKRIKNLRKSSSLNVLICREEDSTLIEDLKI